MQFYGEWLENQALKLLSDDYPQTESGEIPFAWIWVRTVKCPNPACNCRIPLGSSYVLSKSKSAPYWAKPVVENGELHFEIHEGECPKDKESNKASGNGARFRCPVCGEITTDEYIKKMGRSPCPWCTDAGRGDKHQREKVLFGSQRNTEGGC